MALGQSPKTTSGKTIEHYEAGAGASHYKRNILLAIVIMTGVATIGFVSMGGLESFQSASEFIRLSTQEVPPIALNPPDNESRESMREELIESGVDEKDIGVIRKIGDTGTPENYYEDFVFNESNLPKNVPLSEYIVINNIEILEGDIIRYEVENTASTEQDMPFVELHLLISLTRASGFEFETQFYRATSIEFGEEKMFPGEKRIFMTEHPWERLKSAGYEEIGISYNGIRFMWFEINNFEGAGYE